MGGMQTRQITLANLDKFSHIGMFSGGSIAADDPALADPDGVQAEGQGAVRQLRQQGGGGAAAAKANREALEKLGIKNAYYESPEHGPRVAELAAEPVPVRAAAVPGLIGIPGRAGLLAGGDRAG